MDEKTIELLQQGISVVILLAVGLILIKIILHLTKKALVRSVLDGAVYQFVLNSVRIVLWVVLIVALLTQLKVPTAPLVTVLGACGAAVALALKDSLGNIAGGLLILVNQPFKKGDMIDAAGITGVVERIDLFVTTLKTFDNKVITVPNGMLNTSVIVNYSTEPMRRVDCTFGISYDADIAKAKDVILAVAESNSDIYKEPAPFIGVASHLDSAVSLDLKVWCNTQAYYDVKYYLEEQVKLAFDEANISIPYPQMDVHVVK
ncbi:MAG: mechanosensitive ion channel family protein [Firmicutes bacterium]|nr:mechanosensitive ion channel family protein [Bacillota bacterium]